MLRGYHHKQDDSSQHTPGCVYPGRLRPEIGRTGRLTTMLFEKFEYMAQFQAELDAQDVVPFGAVTEKILSATEAVVNGRKVILAGTNNYLGLSFDPRCISAAQEAAGKWGTGTTGSRLANGTFLEHQALESELAAFHGVNHAIIFTTGMVRFTGVVKSHPLPHHTAAV